MILPSQHLSDEAIVAFADGALRPVAHERARRHVDECSDCASAVAVQREAMWALRAAPSPALPSGLLERLREVPTTTPLAPLPVGLDASGAPVFAAYGTDLEANHRRHPPFGALTAVALFAAVGAGLAGMAASQTTATPVAPAQVVPATYSSSTVGPGTMLHVDPAFADWSTR